MGGGGGGKRRHTAFSNLKPNRAIYHIVPEPNSTGTNKGMAERAAEK